MEYSWQSTMTDITVESADIPSSLQRNKWLRDKFADRNRNDEE